MLTIFHGFFCVALVYLLLCESVQLHAIGVGPLCILVRIRVTK